MKGISLVFYVVGAIITLVSLFMTIRHQGIIMPDMFVNGMIVGLFMMVLGIEWDDPWTSPAEGSKWNGIKRFIRNTSALIKRITNSEPFIIISMAVVCYGSAALLINISFNPIAAVFLTTAILAVTTYGRRFETRWVHAMAARVYGNVLSIGFFICAAHGIVPMMK